MNIRTRTSEQFKEFAHADTKSGYHIRKRIKNSIPTIGYPEAEPEPEAEGDIKVFNGKVYQNIHVQTKENTCHTDAMYSMYKHHYGSNATWEGFTKIILPGRLRAYNDNQLYVLPTFSEIQNLGLAYRASINGIS